jgi:hypothetical protein
MGKWARSVRVDRLNEKIKNVQSKIMDEMKKGYS